MCRKKQTNKQTDRQTNKRTKQKKKKKLSKFRIFLVLVWFGLLSVFCVMLVLFVALAEVLTQGTHTIGAPSEKNPLVFLLVFFFFFPFEKKKKRLTKCGGAFFFHDGVSR
jgi:uncharacterized BrkB/YihY/UPF0761 family membrane protein